MKKRVETHYVRVIKRDKNCDKTCNKMRLLIMLSILRCISSTKKLYIC